MNTVTQNSFVSVECKDMSELEPYTLSKEWFSHKTNGPGFHYKILLSIHPGTVVWVYEPFPCGSFSDLRIFDSKMKQLLDEGKKVIADRGYRCENSVTPHSKKS